MTRRPPQRPTQHSAVHAALPQAVALHQAGRTVEAAKLYEGILAQIPRHFDATHLLGVIALQDGKLEQAQRLISSALEIKPKDAAALSNLGIVSLRSGQLEAALNAFERAVKLQPSAVNSLTNLGTVLHQLGRHREALVPLRRAHSLNPKSALVCSLLGACLLANGEAQVAVKIFETATLIEPENPEPWANLAVAFNSMGQRERALECADKAVALNPGSSLALAALAAVEFESGHLDTAIAIYRKAISAANPSTQVYSELANALFTSGRYDEAADCYRQAVKLDANNAIARWKLAMAQCKPVYDSAADISLSRDAFAECLVDLHEWFRAGSHPDAYAAVGSNQPFYLAYQPFSNKDLLSRYGDLCSQWMGSMSSQASSTRERGRSQKGAFAVSRKLRLGIASAHIRDHSVWNAIVKGWVHQLDKAQYEIHLFHLGHFNDEETARSRAAVAAFEDRPENLEEWIPAIREANLDVLIYPEIGIDSLTIQLASLRIAPLQAATWGHPETSGLPTMDLYISASGIEPPNGAGNYRERLVCLPNLGIFVEPLTPTLRIPNLRSLGLPGDEPLLLCPGTPFKYCPVHDKVWAAIARGLQAKKSGRLVFFRGRSESMDNLFEQRLRRVFAHERVNFDARVCLIPTLERAEFFGLMQQSALLLDTLGFSGFNTALQAIECGLPVLAYEGEFMRGRLASGIMRRMGVSELVATSEDDFIRRATQLALDSSRRKQLSLEIERCRDILFRDLEPVRALERCLAEAIAESRGVSS